ncbi:hypothetical protein KUCAC02_016171 [Chaenocephalus aceratus]|uniref:Uncharacterized protein n=1 Tax=Chaenocephalus aceratus TaxID=36190 RepID=A0ACB9Y1S3_CHAAC|nr:hypothetical protein KUCAC02_016171 [Chaenocephalus aceratus]
MAYSAIIAWKPSKDRVAHLQQIWIKPLCPLVFETGEKQLRNYSIIINGTQDVSGVEQEAMCIRYVDHDLIPHEDFVGLYEVSSTTGKNLAKVATDVLLRLNLPLSCLRGQTYDGAANMSG